MRKRVEELGVALALLTRLPLPRLSDAAFARQAQSVWAWPLAGLIVASLSCLLGLAALAVGLPVPVAALLVLAGQMVLTGAMHEDGLADTADGLWGGWTTQRRLDIMKDSHIGTYGVLALVTSVALRWSVLSGLLAVAPLAVLALGAVSRAAMPALMAALPNARGGGLSHQVGPPTGAGAGVAAVVALAAAAICIGWMALPAAISAGMGACILGWIAKRKIGGQTGDILGASQQICEICAGLTLLVLLGG